MSWWKNYKNDFILMLEYIESIKTRKDLETFFKDYKIETIIRMVFESNTIENEGLDLKGTKRLFSELFYPSAELKDNDFKNKEEKVLAEKGIERLKKITNNLNIANLNNSTVVLYKNQKKEFITTLNHLLVLVAIDIDFKENKEEYMNYRNFFTSNGLRGLHENLSRELENNNNGNPGEYRIDGACIDIDTIFLQPSLIPEAIEKALETLLQNLNDGKNIYLEIMLFVAKFIKIHPFGDCNGRLSRILLNLAFLYDGVPFYLVLRSNSRDKKKYIESMKEFYQKKKISKFISVVSRTFIKQIEGINDNLELADKELIRPLKLSNELKEKIKNELENF